MSVKMKKKKGPGCPCEIFYTETSEKKMGGVEDSRGQNPFVEREQSRVSGQGINRIRGY